MTTLEKLKLKADLFTSDKTRMPSIKAISQMLTELGVEHSVDESTNVVEHRTAGKTYVNSRHKGKSGKELVIHEAHIYLDTSDSYYSWNTSMYARNIIEFLQSKKLIKK